MIDFSLQPVDQRFDLQPETKHSLPADDLGVNDRSDAANRLVEVIIDDNVLVLIHCLKLVQSGI